MGEHFVGRGMQLFTYVHEMGNAMSEEGGSYNANLREVACIVWFTSKIDRGLVVFVYACSLFKSVVRAWLVRLLHVFR